MLVQLNCVVAISVTFG